MRIGRRHEAGYSLILFLGVASALAILAVAMVALLVNVTHNTSREQTRTKAFDVAEAALDVTMQRMAITWPEPADADYTWPTTEQAAFESRFGAADFPRPASGRFVKVWVFDNVDDTATPGWETAAPARDANDDGLVYVDAQAHVGKMQARIRALVQTVDFELNVARGFAVWSGGAISANGAGNNPNITAEDFAPGAYSCVAYAGQGFVSADALTAGYVVKQDGRTDPSDPPITQATIDELIEIAKLQGNYFSKDTATAVQSLPLNNYAPPAGLVILDFRGLGTGWNVTIKPGTYNMTSVGDWSNPGALLILGGDLIFQGATEFCGLVYVDGAVDCGGTRQAHHLRHDDLDRALLPQRHGGDPLRGRGAPAPRQPVDDKHEARRRRLA